ncbi:hypothetical protein EC973_001440 [Apophysomyces ossiformis]|uniref:SH3 domain-containing protein n=1 Tax=Apophysomyces ossiformis TaxID=679940 RepID=A0A8H7EN78_9FUNG|nr:hypothetical protein EC973_001440 [Apophysomyces ossiformis]
MSTLAEVYRRPDGHARTSSAAIDNPGHLEDLIYSEEDVDDMDNETASVASIANSDIDFEFVYALHTFVATVEGQASVVKGDTLTLLDDSNSYWWLVNVISTSEIGYIPAENIETPFERLARLNKYRNAQVALVSENFHHVQKAVSPKVQNKKVTLSRELALQLQIILTDDGSEENIEETYEEWIETMREDEDDDEDLSDLQDEERNVLDDSPEACRDSRMATTATEDRLHHISTSSLPLRYPQSLETVRNNRVPETTSSTNSPRQRKTGVWRRLFSRNNKEKRDAAQQGPSGAERPYTSGMNTSPSVSSSYLQSDSSSTRDAFGKPSVSNTQLTVLRVFAGNLNVRATFNTVLVDDETDANQLLIMAIERFRLNDIDGSTMASTNHVEYYLTVKSPDREERTLAPQDKPLAIFESLRSHLTTPMPSLANIEQITERRTTTEITRLGVSRAQQSGKSYFGEDSMVKFYLHKRIKRVNEANGQVYVKISYYTEGSCRTKGDDILRTAFSTKSLKRKTSVKNLRSDMQLERIDKLIAVSAKINMAGLTARALDKFHITCDIENGIRTNSYHLITDCYRIVLLVNGVEKQVRMSSKLKEVLSDETLIPKGTIEKIFLLRKQSQSVLTSNTPAWTPSVRRVPPERVAYLSLPKQVAARNASCANVDTSAESVLKRLDAVLQSMENEQFKHDSSETSVMNDSHYLGSGTSLMHPKKPQSLKQSITATPNDNAMLLRMNDLEKVSCQLSKSKQVAESMFAIDRNYNALPLRKRYDDFKGVFS